MFAYGQQVLLGLAQPAVPLDFPFFAPDRRRAIEDATGVVFLLDGLELVVIISIKCLLPVGLVKVTLIQVSASSGRQFLQPWV